MLKYWHCQTKVKRDSLNNFQRQETARWLLNISQASVIGGAGIVFVLGIDHEVGIRVFALSVTITLVLYLLAMYLGRKVKNVS